jgi:hypothetical protein
MQMQLVLGTQIGVALMPGQRDDVERHALATGAAKVVLASDCFRKAYAAPLLGELAPRTSKGVPA